MEIHIAQEQIFEAIVKAANRPLAEDATDWLTRWVSSEGRVGVIDRGAGEKLVANLVGRIGEPKTARFLSEKLGDATEVNVETLEELETWLESGTRLCDP